MHDVIDSSVWLLSVVDSIGDLLSFGVVLFFRITYSQIFWYCPGLSKIKCECSFSSVLAVILILRSWGGMGVLLAWVFVLYFLLKASGNGKYGRGLSPFSGWLLHIIREMGNFFSQICWFWYGQSISER